MKTKIFILMAMITLTVACKNKKSDNDEPKTQTQTKVNLETQTDFVAMGVIAVPAQDFKKNDVRVEAKINNTGRMTLNLYDVKFAEAMPVTIDMTLPNVEVDSITEKKIGFSGENIVPLTGNSPFEKYTTGQLNGYITPDSLCFTTTLGGIGTTYNGLLQAE